MAYASITYTSASGTTFALTNSSGDPIEYLRQNDISVTVNGVLKTLTTDYTFNTAGTAIVLNTAVSGATVVIARTTDIADATVSFTAGSTLTAQDLNNSDKQNRFALQEFSDIYGALTTGTGDLSALGGFIGSAETWLSDNAHAPTTGAVDTRVDSKIDTALTTDVVAGDSITVTDNSPSSGQITIGVTNASISTAKLVDSSVTTAKIADGNVTTAKILDANVTTAKLADSNVTTAKIADNAITSAKIADGTIVAGDIASDAVTTAKILDSNVTTNKLADGAVTTAKLADSSVTSAKIVDGTIVAGDLASDSVTTAKIVDSNVTTAKINDSAVTTGKIADSAVTAIKIADGVITSAKLNAATVVTAAEQAACTPDDVTFFTTSASDGRYVNVTGDSMTGALAMGSNKITGLGAPTANADAATKQYVDTSVAAGVGDADYGDITVSGTGTVWTIDSGVVTSAKIADGTIVDGDINAAAAIAGTKISPDFGSQNVTTTGTSTAASFIPSSSTAPSNGVYLPAANTVGISTNGSGRLRISSTGTVEIVGAGTIGSTQAVSFNGSAPVNSMVLDSSGRLGVGTSSVNALLEVNNSSAGSEVQRIEGSYNASGSVVLTNWRRTGGAVASAIKYNDATTSISLGTTTSHKFSLRTADTDALTIDTSQRVGIGSTAPTNKLVVSDSGNGGFEVAPGATDIQTYSYNRGTSAYITHTDLASAFIWNNGTAERARIDSSGRLLVGTSTSRSWSGVSSQFQIENTGSGSFATQSIIANTADVYGGFLLLGKSRGTSLGSHTIVQNNDIIGKIHFSGADGSVLAQAAAIAAEVDGTPGAGDMPGRLVFSTTADGASSPTERARITNKGYFKASTTGGYNDVNAVYHEFRSDGADWTFACTNTSSNPYGIFVSHDTLKNNTSNWFYYGMEAGTLRFRVNSNGGIGNYSANDSNLSDRNAKKDISPAAGTWDCIKEWEIVNYRYKDQPDDADLNLGVIAQQVAKSCPEVITVFEEAKDDQPEKLGIREQQMYWMAIKALQEAQVRIEALEAEVAALKAK